jgi:hypothetical protein
LIKTKKQQHMKKIYFSVLSAVFALGINAQTLTQSNHAPVSGDTYSMSVATGTISGPGAQGAGVTWNFSNVTVGSTVTAYSASTSTNTTYNPANVVVNGTNGEASYLLASSSSLKYYGGNIVLGSFPATITYTAPAYYAAYPMSLNTFTTATIGGTLSAASNNGTFSGNNSVIADGTGTLMLPGKTYTNVLRVATSQTINFAVPSLFVSNGVLNQDMYDFYVPGRKSPVMSISMSTVIAPPVITTASSQTMVTVATDYLTGIENNSFANEMVLVYPSPATTFVQFTVGNNAAFVTVYDINGKQVDQKPVHNGSLKLDVSNYANGLYSYMITGNEKEVIKASKFTVAH